MCVCVCVREREREREREGGNTCTYHFVYVFERNRTFWISEFLPGTQMSMSEVCDEHKCVCVCARAYLRTRACAYS